MVFEQVNHLSTFAFFLARNKDDGFVEQVFYSDNVFKRNTKQDFESGFIQGMVKNIDLQS